MENHHNSSKPVLIFWSSIPCKFCLHCYKLLVMISVSFHDNNGFPKQIGMGGSWVGGWGELYPSFVWIFGICLTLQSPLVRSERPLLE